MRAAKLADYRRRLRIRAAAWPLRVPRFSFEDIPALGSAELQFKLPLSVISGANGVGKTTLLRTLWATLAVEVGEHDLPLLDRLRGGTSSADLIVDDSPVLCEATFSAGTPSRQVEHDVEVAHLDCASELAKQTAVFKIGMALQEIVNGAGPRTLDIVSVMKLTT